MSYKKKQNYERYYGGKHYKPIHRSWFYSHAYRDLSCVARALLFEMMMCDRGNNGKIVFSNQQACEALNKSENTIKRAFIELIEHGFIEMQTHENWYKGRAREWRLTFWMHSKENPSHEWENWKPKNKKTASEIDETTSKSEGVTPLISQNTLLIECKTGEQIIQLSPATSTIDVVHPQ